MPILLLLLLWIMAEIAGFAEMGRLVGAGGVLMLILLSGALGALLLRIQGAAMLPILRASMARGGAPERALFNSLFLGLAGILLILPGFVSDIAALLLLAFKLPALVSGAYRMGPRAKGPTPYRRIFINGVEIDPATGKPAQSEVIDVEFREIPPGGRD
jgi:UPF0716 protein FxsA